jgi:hypothetical protein
MMGRQERDQGQLFYEFNLDVIPEDHSAAADERLRQRRARRAGLRENPQLANSDFFVSVDPKRTSTSIDWSFPQVRRQQVHLPRGGRQNRIG